MLLVVSYGDINDKIILVFGGNQNSGSLDIATAIILLVVASGEEVERDSVEHKYSDYHNSSPIGMFQSI